MKTNVITRKYTMLNKKNILNKWEVHFINGAKLNCK